MQAGYYIATGIWPLVSMRSFEAVTGPKTDRWLVRMVGLLAASIGTSIVVGLQEEQVRDETRVLAICSAASFTLIDTVYALKGRISKLYLADAAVEIAFIASLMSPKAP
jgi:hypothetical protein